MWKTRLSLLALTLLLVGCNNNGDNALNDVERGTNDAVRDTEQGVNDIVDDVTPNVNNGGVNNDNVNGVDRNNGAATPGGLNDNNTQMNEGVPPNNVQPGAPAAGNQEDIIEDEADLKDRDKVDNH